MLNSDTVNALRVGELLKSWGEKLEIDILTGEKGLRRVISSDRIQKPGLKLLDADLKLDKGTVQILGKTEIAYFDRLTAAEKKNVTESLMSQDVPCFIVTRDLTPDEKFLEACEKHRIPLFSTKLYTGKLISMLQEILEVRLAPFATAHGVLMDIHRLGVLLLGKSGIGKSECALDLILRGSKLISDDIVEIRKVGPERLVGNGPERIKHLMEIRGVGIINIKDLFGTTSVMEKREIDMVIELVQWNPDTEYDRLGIETSTYNILGIDLPHLVIPVSPGRNTSTIIEVAARNQLLKQSGGRPVQLFDN
ncbi:MAG TPA: HPr(Ser) kinase/phosphatase [Thermodesulfobacteriota bacterium]|nr:HPr(Ser) kinase/phosphatase [Thermodesulfobacteriota bacterium]